MRSTHTYVELELSEPAYREVADKLRAAGYDQAFGRDGAIDLHGLAAVCEQPKHRLLRKYRCNVAGVRIAAITPMRDGQTMIVPDHEAFEPFPVSPEYLQKHNPHVGGYYVRYADGHESFFTAEAFEAAVCP